MPANVCLFFCLIERILQSDIIPHSSQMLTLNFSPPFLYFPEVGDWFVCELTGYSVQVLTSSGIFLV